MPRQYNQRDKSSYRSSSFGNNRGGKGNKRQTKEQRKKGQAKWKNIEAEVEIIENRIKNETPPSGVLYYKYKPKETTNNRDEKAEEQKGQQPAAIQNKRNVIETGDKSLIKIRFSDLPISKNTSSGLFKSKFIKMTEV